MAHSEKEHIVAAFRFELGKVDQKHVRQTVVQQIEQIDHELAVAAAEGIGVAAPSGGRPNHGRSSPALSLANSATGDVATRRVAVLVADGVDATEVAQIRRELAERGAMAEVLGLHDGKVRSTDSDEVEVGRAMNTMGSVLYDGVIVPGGAAVLTTREMKRTDCSPALCLGFNLLASFRRVAGCPFFRFFCGRDGVEQDRSGSLGAALGRAGWVSAHARGSRDDHGCGETRGVPGAGLTAGLARGVVPRDAAGPW